MEAIQHVETEIVADFLDEFDTRTEIKLVQPYVEPVLLPGGVAYRRPPYGA